MKKVLKWVGIVIGAFIVLGIIGSIVGGNNSDDNKTASQPNTTASKPVKTEQKAQPVQTAPQSPDDELAAMLKAAPAPSVVKSDVDIEVTYTLTNNTKNTFDYVELDVQFFDKAGVKLDDEMTNTTNVTPGQKFQLKVNTMETASANWKVVGIYSSSLHN